MAYSLYFGVSLFYVLFIQLQNIRSSQTAGSSGIFSDRINGANKLRCI